MNQALCRSNPQVVTRWWLAGVALLLAALAAPVRGQESYSYFRTVEGVADLETATDGEVLEVIENHPLVPGDLLRIGSASRVEAVLSDGTVLRLDEGTEVVFETLAWTPDTDDTATRLTLLAGELQALVGFAGGAGSPLTVETRNATLYLESPGEYRVTFDGYEATEVIVRDGTAEAQTDRGSAIVRAGEAGYIDGGEWATVDVAAAAGRDRLEYWGDELDAEARLAQVPQVEPGLRYRAARMAGHGAWIEVGGRSAWRPYVDDGWRPYTAGSWVYTPSGLTWVSNEPWGWIPSHYGSWELVPGHGWVWFAGAAYSPAWVYWYWGPTHVAWVPSGYYTAYYGGYNGYVPRHGVYGWAGGSWGHFGEWVFCPTRYFGRPHYQRYFRSGHEVARHATYRDLPRGVIATDTRSLRRDVWGQPEAIQARLATSRSRLASSGDLPDVTDFVARRRDIRPDVAEIVRPQAAEARRRSAGTAEIERGQRSPAARRMAFDRSQRAAVSGDRVAPRAERGEITVRSRSRFETRGTGDLRVYDRAGQGRPRVEARGFDSGRPVVDRRGRAIESGVDEGRRALPQRTPEERPIAQRVIEQVRERRGPSPGDDRAGSPSARSSASRPEARSSEPPRARSASPQGRERASRPPQQSSRGGEGKSQARQRASSDRKPPGD